MPVCKRISIHCDNILRNRDALQGRAEGESPVADACHAVRNRDTLQGAANLKSPGAYTCYAVRNRDASQGVATIKSVVADDFRPFTNCIISI